MSEQPKELKVGRLTVKLYNQDNSQPQKCQKPTQNNPLPFQERKQNESTQKVDFSKKEKDKERIKNKDKFKDKEKEKERDNERHHKEKEYFDSLNHHYKSRHNKSHSRSSPIRKNKSYSKSYSHSHSHSHPHSRSRSRSMSHSYTKRDKKTNKHYEQQTEQYYDKQYEYQHYSPNYQHQHYDKNYDHDQHYEHHHYNPHYDQQHEKNYQHQRYEQNYEHPHFYPPKKYQNNPNDKSKKTNSPSSLGRNYSNVINNPNMNKSFDKLLQNKKEELLYQQQNQLNTTSNQQYQNPSHTSQPKEPSNTIMLSNMGPDINKDILEDIFREKCLDFQTSMPEEIRVIEELKMAYIIFPSVSSCIQVYEELHGKILINGNFYDLAYTPNILQHNKQESVTYVTHLTDANSLTTSMETIVHEDWYCEYCECKNFSRRTLCFKCKRPKTLNCRIAPVIKQKTTIIGEHGVIPPNTSLMIRGNCLKTSNEGELLEHFSKYGQIKDIRMVRDHLSESSFRDYAFIEYFSIEESTNALEQMKEKPLYIRGDLIFAAFSKIKREDYSNVPLTQQAQINTSILTNEEKEKLNNITMLQNICEQNRNEKNKEQLKKVSIVSTSNVDDVNIRREVTQREKVELELKKWAKKADKKNSNLALKSNILPQTEIIINPNQNFNNLNQQNQLSQGFNQNNNQNIYDNVISLETMTEKATINNSTQIIPNNQNISSNSTNNNSLQNTQTNNNNLGKNTQTNTNTAKISSSSPTTTFICYICQRKFVSEEKLKNHEKLSELHKKNLAKLQQQNKEQNAESNQEQK